MNKNIKLLVENIFDDMKDPDGIENSLSITKQIMDKHNEYIKSLIETGNNEELKQQAIGDFVIPDGTTKIGERAFTDCKQLTSITIPDSVTKIGKDTFLGCYGLTEVHITDLTKWCQIDFDHYYANPLYYANYLYINGKKITNIEIPNSVIQIKNYTFYGYKKMKSVTIPNSVTEIGKAAFFRCGLTSVIIPNSVRYIYAQAFGYCTKLTSVIIPNSVIAIGESTFNYQCNKLTKVFIDVNLTLKIYNDAFSKKVLYFYVKNKLQKLLLLKKYNKIKEEQIIIFKQAENLLEN